MVKGMKTLNNALICIAASLAVVGHAQGACPVGLVNPVYFLNGTNWAFLTHSGGAGDADIGIFTATAHPPSGNNPFYTGVLNGTQTSNNAGAILIRAPFSGKYQVNSDCLGGTFFFNISGNAYQYAFVVASTTELYLLTVSNDTPNNGDGPTAGQRGAAILLAGPPQCPAGISPLSLLAGNWSFLTQDYGSASIGSFTAQFQPTLFQGTLQINQTTSAFRFLDVDEVFNGSYQVYSDCSGGSLVFPFGGDAFAYEFVFASPRTIFMVSSSTAFFSNTVGVFRGHFGTAMLRP
jgi:hypothetical protein